MTEVALSGDVVTLSALATDDGLQHGFFTRAGGVSEGIFSSLNCGLGSQDDKARVAENRGRVASYLGTCEPVVTVYQVHSATAVVATGPWATDAVPQADGIVTATRGLAIGVLTADCTPVLFADPRARIVGACHAGWRGALDGVIEATLSQMENLGANRADIRAGVGPTIHQSAYEVGPEFEDRFVALDNAYSQFFAKPDGQTRAHFDLPGFVLHRLRGAGVSVTESCGLCTYSDESRFFSYRRATHQNHPDYGRQISAIVLR